MAGFKPVDVEQVGHHVVERLAVLEALPHELALITGQGAEAAILHQLERAEQAGQWAAQVMGDHLDQVLAIGFRVAQPGVQYA